MSLLVILTGCAQTPTPTIPTVRFGIFTDTSTAPLMDQLAAAYQIGRPNVTILVQRTANSERALEALDEGQSALASVSWLPEDQKTGGVLWYRPYARDSIVIITHSSNPVGGLTLAQLRSIFQGRTLFWEELGGPEFEVTPVSRESGAGSRLSFESLVMGNRDVAPTAVVMPSSKAVVDFVSVTPGAIGYVSQAWLVPSVNLLAVDGVTPSPASVSDGRYLLARPFYLIAHGPPENGIAEFVNWVKEGDGQEIIMRRYALAP